MSEYCSNELFQAIKGRTNKIELIIEKEPHLINTHDMDGWTPLMKAAWGKHPEEILLSMIDKATTENLQSSSHRQFSLLHAIVRGGYVNAVDKFLSRVKTLDIINQKTLDIKHVRSLNTPLHFCMFDGIEFKSRYAIAKMLIENGADIQIKNKEEHTPLEKYLHRIVDSDEQKQKMIRLFGGTGKSGEVRRMVSKVHYKLALKEHSTETNRLSRLMLIGQERAGKTCLKNSLLGKEFNEHSAITDCLTTTGIFIIDGECWTEKEENGEDNQDILDHGISASVNILEQQEDGSGSTLVNTNGHSSGNVKQENTGEPQVKKKKVEEDENDEEKMNGGHSLESQEQTKMDEGTMEIKSYEDESGQEMLSFKIWDFGGQLVYNSIKRLFMTPEALYLLVFKLDVNLDDPAKIVDSCGVEHDYRMTNLEFLLYCVRSIYSAHSTASEEGGQEQKLEPKIFVVGTHRDSLSKDEDEKKEKVAEKWKKIKNALKETAYESLVFLEEFFDVENKNQNDGKIIKLKQTILDYYQKRKTTVPLKWLKFLIELQKSSCYTMPYEKVKELASKPEFEIGDSLISVLTFFHDHGQVLFYPEVDALKDQVVIQPFTLVVMYKTVITAVRPDLELESDKESWKNLEENGILDEGLLKNLWKDFEIESFEFHVNLMQMFGIVCKIVKNGKQSFLVPSRFRPTLSAEMQLSKQNHAVTLLFDFCGYFPDELAHQVFAKALEDFPQESDNFLQEKLSNKQVVLNFESHDLSLTTRSVKKHQMLQMTIVRSGLQNEGPSREICKKALQKVNGILEKLRVGRWRQYKFKKVIQCMECKHLHLLDKSLHSRPILPCGCRAFELPRVVLLFGLDVIQNIKEPLDDILLLSIADEVGRDWKQLGIRLGNGCILGLSGLERIQADNNSVVIDSCLEMLVRWRESIDLSVNKIHLMRKALKDTGYAHFAGRLGRDTGSHSCEGYLDDMALWNVCEDVGSSYQSIAITLGIRQSTISRIQSENDGVRKTAMALFVLWRGQQPPEVNLLSEMCSALTKNKLIALSERLKKDEHALCEGFLDECTLLTICEKIASIEEYLKLGIKLKFTFKALMVIKNNNPNSIMCTLMEMLTQWRERQASSVNQREEMQRVLNECIHISL